MFRTTKRPVFFLLVLLALFIAVNGALSLSVGYAEGPNQKRQILSLKLSWVTPDNDGDPSRLLIHREFDPDTPFSMQYQIEAILTGQEPHEPGTVRILAPKQIFHKRGTSAGGSVLTEGYRSGSATRANARNRSSHAPRPPSQSPRFPSRA